MIPMLPLENTEIIDMNQLLQVLMAVKKGDFSVRMPVNHIGLAGKIADTLNDIIELNQKLAMELDEVSTVVGKEGITSQRANIGGTSGAWTDCINSVNDLITDLVQPTAEVVRVIREVARGDLSQTIALEIDNRPLKGEFLQTAQIVNRMVDQLNSFAAEVTRVAREVGTEGKLGGQAAVQGVAGVWKDLTDNVNLMANNLTSQVRNIAEVTTAVANGDLSKKITVDVRGEILDLKNTINEMVDQLNSFASEVTRVAREVGTEGNLGGQADVQGVGGVWKDLTDNVNLMANNLTSQVRNIAEVTTAVANGDLSKQITVDVRGEILDLKNTINEMVDQLNSFASEVTRVAREVGTEGNLGGQADVQGVGGVWKDLTDNVNLMANNLTYQVRNIAEVTTAVANGDLSKKITVDVRGEILDLKNTINVMVDQLNSFASEVTRVAREVGTEGNLGGQADVQGVGGVWKDLTDNVNLMANNLTYQVRNIAEVTTAVANGDLSKKITVDVRGEILDLKNTINVMVDQLNSFASEVTRVAREVGTEGKLGGQAEVRGVAGVWKDLTNNVNLMANNLTYQVRNIAEVTTAVANGDLSKKITVDVRGEILELKNTINEMVDQLNSFGSEVTRVAREVGTEGKLGGQAEVRGGAGVWKDLTDNVNLMANNLTYQVRNIAEVTTAVANGDLSKKITVDVRGEILELKNTINEMVDQLNSFASEVTRVAREVGTEGKLGGQAEVRGGAGVWKDLTDNVNLMANNLTSQVRNIAEVTTAVATGDLSKKITVDVRGEILELKNTINEMVDQLNSFASEVTRVAREVGTEGKLGGQAEVRGGAGVWKDLTDNVNLMANNLTSQVRNIAEVSTAIATGDLSKKITVDARGEILELKNTINVMVDQLNSFASEVTRVAREVGTEGNLGGQADVKGVGGVWKDLTDNVNQMANNLTYQVRNIAEVTTAVANGDLSKKITVDVRGEILDLKNTINVMVDQLNSFGSEVTRVAREVGTEGKLGGQADVRGVAGVWKDLTDNVNQMANNLTSQVRNIAEVTTAVANGDLSKKITVDVRGEILELKNTINVMVDQLNSFASEVTRVAREVGTEGNLGGQADVRGVAGVWKDLTDNVNLMATNLTEQVRGIARVVTAVANGNLKQNLALGAKGEIATLADTINEMIDTLATFADQVTTVAREVGIEGKLGGAASVPNAAGTWRDLTGNVNQLAANLTTQVRAIGEVVTAVTQGDLSRSITVELPGELSELKFNINQMIVNLRETTQKNNEQDWLKTNLAKFTRMLQGQRELETVSRQILSELAPLVSAQHGVFFLADMEHQHLRLISSYAYKERKSLNQTFKLGEGLVGQCAIEKERILLSNVPTDYVVINSGLGESVPLNIVVIPVLFEGQVTAIIELASFSRFSEIHLNFLDQLTESIGIVLNNITVNMRTETLLIQSQSLTEELQNQQRELTETNRRLEQQARSLQASEDLLRSQREELQNTNEELEEKARLLARQNNEVEQKNREIEEAKQDLEEKAAQLALSSKYKSEFLANMSHELRTPLNSMLILSRILAENSDTNLSDKQVELAKTIYTSGSDLLSLINNILDLSKIESGNMTPDIEDLIIHEIVEDTDRSFRQLAENKRLVFKVDIAPDLPRLIRTDGRRLQQILKNLLANAIKFTDEGEVSLEVYVGTDEINLQGRGFTGTDQEVIAFAVRDTGIGIPADKQKIIFEAFQQADGTTNRKYGGTGLGLSISRDLAQMLGGEIKVVSNFGEGSTFTLYLPQSYTPMVSRPEPADNKMNMPFRYPKNMTRTMTTIAPENQHVATVPVGDDRTQLEPNDRVVLIVEDELSFAQSIREIAHEIGFKTIIKPEGEAVETLIKQYRPDAIILDILLPGMDGWIVLDHLKHNLDFSHIPVCVISGTEGRERAFQQGAMAYFPKPVTPEDVQSFLTRVAELRQHPLQDVLVIVSPTLQSQAEEVLKTLNVSIHVPETPEDGMEQIIKGQMDCVLLEYDWLESVAPDFLEMLRKTHRNAALPILLYSSRDYDQQELFVVKRLVRTIPVQPITGLDQLLYEVTMRLHYSREELSQAVQDRLLKYHRMEPLLVGKRVLIVDDDVRNIFAITSLLERSLMQTMYAESGMKALQILDEDPNFDIVLMDIMMPEMDGYETIGKIRQNDQFAALPIIAVTAKAMPEDRQKCLAAGASEYITKPIDFDLLLSLIRVFLYRA